MNAVAKEMKGKCFDDPSNCLESQFYMTDMSSFSRKGNHRGRHGIKRKYKNINGITLHQTGSFEKFNKGYVLTVPCHYYVFPDGQIAQLHKPDCLVWHAQQLSKQDICIEISCRTAGIYGQRRTFWRSKEEISKGIPYSRLVHDPTELQFAAVKALIRNITAEVKKHDGEILYLHAHRQSTINKSTDPGSKIWYEVAIPMMKELKLSCGNAKKSCGDFKLGSGMPIPIEWDSEHGVTNIYGNKVKSR